MQSRTSLRILIGFATCAAALLILQQLLESPETAAPPAQCARVAASRLAAASMPAPPLLLEAQRTVEIVPASREPDRGDPVRIAQEFIDALFAGRIEEAAAWFVDAERDPDFGRGYLRLYYDLAIKKGFSKVDPATFRFEATECVTDDLRGVAVLSGGRRILVVVLGKKDGIWSVGLME